MVCYPKNPHIEGESVEALEAVVKANLKFAGNQKSEDFEKLLEKFNECFPLDVDDSDNEANKIFETLFNKAFPNSDKIF